MKKPAGLALPALVLHAPVPALPWRPQVQAQKTWVQVSKLVPPVEDGTSIDNLKRETNKSKD